MGRGHGGVALRGGNGELGMDPLSTRVELTKNESKI